MKIPPEVDEFLKNNKNVTVSLLEKEFPHIEKVDLENFIVQQKWAVKTELRGTNPTKKLVKWIITIILLLVGIPLIYHFFPSDSQTAKKKIEKSGQKVYVRSQTVQSQEAESSAKKKTSKTKKNQKELNPDEQLKKLNKAIDQGSAHAVNYLNRGLLYLNQGKLDKAMADFNKVISMSPNNARAFSYRAIVFFRQGKNNSAMKDLNKTIELRPHSAAAYKNRGLVLYRMKKYDRMCLDFDLSCDYGDCDSFEWAKKNKLCK